MQLIKARLAQFLATAILMMLHVPHSIRASSQWKDVIARDPAIPNPLARPLHRPHYGNTCKVQKELEALGILEMVHKLDPIELAEALYSPGQAMSSLYYVDRSRLSQKLAHYLAAHRSDQFRDEFVKAKEETLGRYSVSAVKGVRTVISNTWSSRLGRPDKKHLKIKYGKMKSEVYLTALVSLYLMYDAYHFTNGETAADRAHAIAIPSHRRRDTIRALVETWLSTFGIKVRLYDDADRLARDVESIGGPFSTVADKDAIKVCRRVQMYIETVKDAQFAQAYKSKKALYQRRRYDQTQRRRAFQYDGVESLEDAFVDLPSTSARSSPATSDLKISNFAQSDDPTYFASDQSSLDNTNGWSHGSSNIDNNLDNPFHNLHIFDPFEQSGTPFNNFNVPAQSFHGMSSSQDDWNTFDDVNVNIMHARVESPPYLPHGEKIDTPPQTPTSDYENWQELWK